MLLLIGITGRVTQIAACFTDFMPSMFITAAAVCNGCMNSQDSLHWTLEAAVTVVAAVLNTERGVERPHLSLLVSAAAATFSNGLPASQ